MQHGKLRSHCGSRLVNEFALFINFKDTYNLIFFTYSK